MPALGGSGDYHQRLGLCIKRVSTDTNMSLKELAQQIGISPATLYQYVRGLAEVPESVLLQIEHVTGTNPRRLLE